MDLDKLNIEIIKSIEELNLNSGAKFTAQISTGNFIYFLTCLKKDFSLLPEESK